MLLHFGQFKGKRNGGPEAPKLRNHFRAEVLEQRMYCVREKEIETKGCLKMYLCLISVNYEIYKIIPNRFSA